MGTVLNPYLNFRGNAREAMQFYEQVFGGELTLGTFGEFQAAHDPSENDLIMHGDLEASGGIRLMGSDTPKDMQYEPGTNVSLSLSGEDEDELRGYFDKLAEGGTVTVPLDKAMWGDMFGMCTDRFGIQWLVNINLPK